MVIRLSQRHILNNIIANSYDLLIFLKKLNLLEDLPPYWWPNYGNFEVVLGTFLTQNSRWANVEKSLQNIKEFLQEFDLDDNDLFLEKIANIDLLIFAELIKSSGFKNQKALRIKNFCQNLQYEFTNFSNFQNHVSRSWLLAQQGIGKESADSILCYACKKDFMVVDNYTKKLLSYFDYKFNSYQDTKEWLEYGINKNYDKIVEIYNFEISLNQIYARMHGKIVEYMKQKDKR